MKNNLKIVDLKDLDSIAYGCSLLGSGGGGSTTYPLMIAKNSLINYGSVQIISKKDLKDDDLIVPIGYAGSPLVCKEKIPSKKSLIKLFSFIEFFYKKKITALTVTEIGGGNGLVPFFIAGELNLSILDADMLGRAFPKVSMISSNVYNVLPEISFLVDDKEQISTIAANDFDELEHYARALAMAAGSSIAIVPQVLSGKQAKDILIHQTLSKAFDLGNKIKKNDINELPGKMIAEGKIIFIDQSISDGFSNGKIIIEAFDNEHYTVLIKNEYLAILKDDNFIAKTPDIISVLHRDTMKPILSDELEWNMGVYIFQMKTEDIWYTKKGYQLVNLEACLK